MVEEVCDGKDYVVELRNIRLGFGARMLLQKTDLVLERHHRSKSRHMRACVQVSARERVYACRHAYPCLEVSPIM